LILILNFGINERFFVRLRNRFCIDRTDLDLSSAFSVFTCLTGDFTLGVYELIERFLIALINRVNELLHNFLRVTTRGGCFCINRSFFITYATSESKSHARAGSDFEYASTIHEK